MLENKLPLYEQISQAIRNEIISKNLQTGTFLGTEDSFIKKFKVSRITIRRALRELETSGLVNREIGKGTYVNSC